MTTVADSACPHCGAENEAGAEFCGSCGKALPRQSATGPRVLSATDGSLSASGREFVADDLKRQMNKASGALLAVAILQTIVGPILLLKAKADMEKTNPGVPIEIKPIGYVMIFGIAIAFYVLWLWSRKNPFPAAIVGLVLFVTLHLLDAVVDPATIVQGILVKIIVVVVLAKAVSAGAKYRQIQKQSQG
jgi:hypothetical protein